ncbi:MAG: hypothetical protein ACR2IJ_11010 [Fluviibacter sp.]
MNNYGSIHESLNFYEKNLGLMENGTIEKSKDEISSIGLKIKESISKLQQERAKEKDFFGFLEQKYGPGQFDVETFEYKTTK